VNSFWSIQLMPRGNRPVFEFMDCDSIDDGYRFITEALRVDFGAVIEEHLGPYSIGCDVLVRGMKLVLVHDSGWEGTYFYPLNPADMAGAEKFAIDLELALEKRRDQARGATPS
jgi:hypothetical protein